MPSLRSDIDVFIPDGTPIDDALGRTSHLGIGAHPDDLEILAFHGIAACFRNPAAWFTGVVVCDGAGSPRAGRYQDLSDADMAALRREEQRSAAGLGQYGLQLQLGHSSDRAKAGDEQIAEDLSNLLAQSRPSVLYLHNPADAHATHRAVLRACLTALRRLDPGDLPAEIYGVEVWRSLDWLPPSLRVALPVADPEDLQGRLLRCHDSQISGGKRYDLAILARQRANATLAQFDTVDSADACVLAMDLNPLVRDPTQSEHDWLAHCLRHVEADVDRNLKPGAEHA